MGKAVRVMSGVGFPKAYRRVILAIAWPVVAGALGAGCSSDVTRFEFPAFGLTEHNPTARPVPPAAVYDQTADSANSPYGAQDNGFGQPDPYNNPGYAKPFKPQPYSPDANASGGAYGTPDYGGYGDGGGGQQKYEVTGLPPSGPGGVDGDQYLQGHGAAYLKQRKLKYGQAPAYAPDAAADPYAAEPKAPGYVEPDAAAAASGGTIVVGEGDTLYKISRRYNVSVAALMQANNLQTPAISMGRKLVIPGGANAAADEPAARPKANQVASLDNGVTEEPVADAAPEPKNHAVANKPAGQNIYKVKAGESFFQVAKSLGVSPKSLAEANGIDDPSKIKEGQILHLPGHGLDSVDSKDNPYGSLNAEKVAALQESANDPAAPGTIEKPLKKAKKVASLPAPANDAGAADPGYGNDTPAAEDGVVSASPDQGNAVEDGSGAGKKSRKVANADPASGDAAAAEATGFRWPVRGRIIQKFGKLDDGTQNDGINVAVPLGTEVHAAEEGTVAYAGSELKGYGNLVLIRHTGNWVSAYAHNQEILVKRGDKITRGQVIARAGKTGSVSQPQVHFELRKGSLPVDPMPHMASN